MFGKFIEAVMKKPWKLLALLKMISSKNTSFYQVIEAAGLNPFDYPVASSIPVILYDENSESLEQDMPLTFAEPLFVANPAALEEFHNYVRDLESQPASRISGTIGVNLVALHDQTNRPQKFWRTQFNSRE